MRRILNAAALAAISLLVVSAQTPQTAGRSDSFEVASIKPSDPSDTSLMHLRYTPGGGVIATNAQIRTLIRLAYHVQDFQISGLPAWAESARFDIEAKSPDAPLGDPHKLTADEANEFQARVEARLRALLDQRFNLKLHREKKEMPIYALRVAKSGVKLAASPSNGAPVKRGMRLGRGSLAGTYASTAMLAQALSDVTGRSVVDETGLSCFYDFKLNWTPDPSPGADVNTAPADAGPSLFTALEEQLGLKLQSAKGPVEVLVIDHIQKPDAN